MSYRRSYEYTTAPEQREEFMKRVKTAIHVYWWPVVFPNNYPYDMFRDKKIKTKHNTLFFNKFNKLVVDEIEEYNSLWYTVIINSSDNQSIPEINHLHFIKTIDEN